jgi:pimeloyl-ACP methyl ester carboxylesterase
MTKTIILHGYSDQYKSFIPLRDFLCANGVNVTEIALGNYITLEDHVTIEDLAKAFKSVLKAKGIPTDPGSFDLIVHSTGGLVAREWLSRYYLETGRGCPVKHLLMLAPANFGSPLAQLGQTMFGRIVKGWQSNFEVGTKVLEALEMGSPYSWRLADRDLFGSKSFFDPAICMTAVFVGSLPYQAGLRQVVNKNGSDGTVYVATANLNATALAAIFPAGTQLPILKTRAPAYQPVAFAVFPNRTHESITLPGDPPADFGQLIIDFLQLIPVNYPAFLARCQALTDQTLPPPGPNPDNPYFHRYQNLVTSVVDDFGTPVPDYFLEFYERPHSAEDAASIDQLMLDVHTQVIQDVHNFKNDESYRSIIFDLTRLDATLAGNKELMFSLSAAGPSNLIDYSVGAKNNAGELPLDQNSPNFSTFFRPNQTLFVDITVERTQDSSVFALL